MKKLILFLGMLSVTIMSVFLVMAADASNPYTVTMKWIVPSDTSFSVSLAGAETTIDFDDNLTSATQDQIQPDGQTAESSTPIATITNDGNTNLNFTGNLTTSKPSFAVVCLNNASSFAGCTYFNTGAVTIADNVAASASSDLYIWSNTTNADAGTTSRTFQINSIASS